MVYILQPTSVVHHESTDDIPSTSQHSHSGNQETESSFKWTSERLTHEVADFNDFQSGIHLEPSEIPTECDVFRYFMDNDLMSMIVNMTNKFHTYFLLNVDLRIHSRLQAWYDVTIPEMYIFFAIIVLMTRNRQLTIEEHCLPIFC